MTKRRIGYLYASYAATLAYLGALLAHLALNPFATVVVVATPFVFTRDKRRVLAGRQNGNLPGRDS